MKLTDKGKPIRTIPKGAWEAGLINERKKPSKKQHLKEISTDAQGNGYPVNKNMSD